MGSEGERRDAQYYARVVLRRLWIILLGITIVPAIAVMYSFGQAHRYSASSLVLVSQRSVGASLTNTPDTLSAQDPERFIDTQARLARVTAVARRVLDATGITDETPRDFLKRSSVKPDASTDLLVMRVTDSTRALAMRQATEYSRQFANYRRELDTQALERARREVAARLRSLRAAGREDSTLYNTLLDKEQQLRTLEALQTSNAYPVQPAVDSVRVQPRPVRNGIMGFVIGLVLGVGLAFLRDALGTRVRSAEEIAERLGLPLLARLRAPPRRLRTTDRLAMVAEPTGLDAEAYRLLRTNLEFANLERGARTIVVTSAVEEEGKSTTAANLAVAFARRGLRVVLVDLDLRRPKLHRFFGFHDRPGLTDVALGHADLEHAIHSVALTSDRSGNRAADSYNGNGSGEDVRGVLQVLPAGSIPPDPGEFVATSALAALLGYLRDNADLVLIDSAPLLHVGDTMTLSTRADALVVLARVNVIRRRTLQEVRRVLRACPTHKLGFVLTGASGEEAYGYDYHRYSRRAAAHTEPERVA